MKFIETKLQSSCFYFSSYKAFLKNKKRSGTSLLVTFFAWRLKKNISLVILYWKVRVRLYCRSVFRTLSNIKDGVFFWKAIAKNRYFLIRTSNENNLIYFFITQTPKREIKHSFWSSWVVQLSRTRFCILAILFIYKLTSLLDITGLRLSTKGAEHCIFGVLLKLLFSVNFQITVAYRAIRSLHFHHLWVRHTMNDIIPHHMWVRNTVRNVGLPHLGFPFPVGPPPSSLCNRSFQSY